MKWFILDRNTWNHLIVLENELSFVYVIRKMFTNQEYLIYKQSAGAVEYTDCFSAEE